MNNSHPAASDAPQHMTALEKSGELLFRLRDYTPIPIIILAVLFAMPNEDSLLVGLIVALFGEFVRTYGVAFIGTISRTRSYSNGQLVQEGPFALLRNPLYFGNLVLTLGLSIMPNVIWLPILVVVLFYAQYIPIVAWEEMKLRRIFGEAYLEYCRKVPRRWFPPVSALFRWNWYERPSTWKPALKSEKRTLTSLVTFVIVMAALYYVNETRGGELLPLVQRFLP